MIKLLEKLSKERTKELAAREKQREYIIELRANNITWKRIAKALGMTTQGCWRKYHNIDL